MKIASLIARYLLGLIFFVFGLNGFLHFIPQPPMPPGPGADFATALFVSRYLVVVLLLEIIPAILLFANRYVPLALVLLGPVIVNIFLFHAFMAPSGLPLALVVVVLWLLVAASVRSAFTGIFQQRVAN
jgi:putative oxidoreductase